MGWQEDERQARATEEDFWKREEEAQKRREEAESKAISEFWNKIVTANAQLLPNIQATLHKYADEQILAGKNPRSSLHCRYRKDGLCQPSLIDDGKTESPRGSIRYDSEHGLVLTFPSGYGHQLRDTDIASILKDLCSGWPFYHSIAEKLRNPQGEKADETEPEDRNRKGFFGRFFKT